MKRGFARRGCWHRPSPAHVARIGWNETLVALLHLVVALQAAFTPVVPGIQTLAGVLSANDRPCGFAREVSIMATPALF
jgi:hypothetical protein